MAVVGQRVVYMGGLTEQKSMLGMKSRNEYLAGDRGRPPCTCTCAV